MTRTIHISGENIKLHENPKHRAVQQVQDIMTTWILGKAEMNSIDPDMELEDAIKAALLKDPKLAAEITSMQRTLPLDQTIMLATNMSYNELQALADDMTEADYLSLYNESIKTIGGTADDFFGVYSSDITGIVKQIKQEMDVQTTIQEP